MKKLLVCTCFNQEKKAIQAFSVLFPNEVCPDIIKGRDRIFKFAQSIGNKHIEAISKLSGRFSYYVEIEGNNIVMEYDLVHGKRLR